MSLNNTSQLLLRNTELLKAKTPLLINFSADSFLAEYLQNQPLAQVTCYNTNFEHHQLLKEKYGAKVECYFSAQYQTKTKHDLVMLQFPKSKAELNFTLAMIHHCCTTTTAILVVGENKGGIKSIDKLTKETFSFCNKIDSARHCVLFSCALKNSSAEFSLNEWYCYYSIVIEEIEIKIAALPGVFSQSGLDKGTELLLHNLPNNMQGEVLDFGCGAGVIASFIGKKYKNTSLSLLDVSALALESARKTLEINQLTGTVFASNSLSQVKEKYHYVVSNPPFHQGVNTNYEATETFLKDIKQYLCNKGNVTIVANSFLKYQPIMVLALGYTDKIITDKGFSVYQYQH